LSEEADNPKLCPHLSNLKNSFSKRSAYVHIQLKKLRFQLFAFISSRVETAFTLIDMNRVSYG